MERSRYGDLFLAESREHISAMNHLLLALEADPAAREPVEGLFRAVHTIKGMSATMGYRAVADLSHEMEELLEELRQGVRSASSEVVEALFAATDGLEVAVEHAVVGRESAHDATPLIERLRGLARPGDRDGGPGALRVEVELDAGCALPGVRAFLLLRRARELGEVADVQPAEPELQAGAFDGRFAFSLRCDRPAAELEPQLRAVGEIAALRLRAAAAVPALTVELAPSAEPAPTHPAGPGAAGRARQMRVDPARLDAMMNQAGELVILRDRLRRIVAEARSAELSEVVDQTSRLIDELQNEIMRVRLVPVAQVFDRFPRMVRDAAQSLGKQVDFEVEGSALEFDRSLLDEMSDPIVHLLRNSIDHGVEPPGERLRAGKPETATVQLVAARERSRAVIRVSDDGRGIPRERVVSRAVAQGLVSPAAAAALSDDEIYRLLLQPGFSTAEQVTDVSGRGVGLDVVATRVRSVGGTLEITSEPGRGTSFTLRLPLTLAIVQALIVGVGRERYAVPIAHVAESAEVEAAALREVGGQRVAMLREALVPVLPLGEALAAAAGPPARLVPLVVLELGEQQVALQVDALLGQQEIVVKSFDATSDTLRAFSGATILPDGRPALILDVGAVPAMLEGTLQAVRS